MIAADKAKQLIGQYKNILPRMDYSLLDATAKECALIALDEISEAIEAFGYAGCMYNDFETGRITDTDTKNPTEYWQQVKEEINKL